MMKNCILEMFVKTELRFLIEFKKLCNGQRKRQVSLEHKQNKTNKQTNIINNRGNIPVQCHQNKYMY